MPDVSPADPVRRCEEAGRVGGGCWRKLAPAQRAAIRAYPARIRAILTRPIPVADDQLPLDLQEIR